VLRDFRASFHSHIGQVYIGTDDRVQYVCGKGEPPAEGMVHGDELRRLLVALDQVPSYAG